VVFEGKVPKKPLALLKALIAFGGHAVPEHVLTDALWPDEEADAAHDAFNVALHRLRKLVPQGSEIIRLQEGHLGLEYGECWIDCRAFEQLIDEAGGGLVGADVALAPLHAALALYQGRFLAAEDNEAWSLSARERLRAKFNRLVGSYGGALLRAGRTEEALACYKRGIEADDLAEEFYQGVMRCALKLRLPAEGLAAYQRLQRMLSLLLGVAPSGPSEALRKALLEA
jgi:two-component SAPR family response regulator